jgi:hypothetical protein
MATPTRVIESTAPLATLFVALELGSTRWKLAFAVTRPRRPRMRTMRAGDIAGLWAEIETAKARLGLDADAPVSSCYEAGRDGFWLHRVLSARGVTSASSIPRVLPSTVACGAPRRIASTRRNSWSS